jgi:uncharacterized DUF497 family protein
MNFEWDEAKRLANIAKHGLDFRDADLLFEANFLRAPAKSAVDELREMCVGRIAGRYVTLIFTERDGAIRCISLRRARNHERQQHQTLFGG